VREVASRITNGLAGKSVAVEIHTLLFSDIRGPQDAALRADS